MSTTNALRIAVAAATALAFATPSLAQTEADCIAAVDSAQAAIESSPALQMESEDKAQEAQSILAEASEAGLQGNYKLCIERVEDAKGSAGLN